ncbi:MAG: rhomboid family intramembrane serine protease, partial [Muribaculaceae bacterium]|nr:rhomboid family intramembrane serine protease [Muribaculaceae bacterium]
ATVGASGAIYGILLAFGMLWPDMPLYIMFIPVPVKAKWMVAGYAGIELLLGLQNSVGDNVAHFAHLGGMLIGLVMILYWKRSGLFHRRW